MAALLFVGIFAPSFVLLAMLWFSLAERHQLEVEKRGLERSEAIQALRRGVELEIQLLRSQSQASPQAFADLPAPLRLRDDGTLLPFENEHLQTELVEDALLLESPAFFNAVREEQRGAYPVALLHYRRALQVCKGDLGSMRRIELAMARVQHRAGKDVQAVATLTRLGARDLTASEAWECARLLVCVSRADVPGDGLKAAQRDALARLEELRPQLGLLEYLTLKDEIGGQLDFSTSQGPLLQLYRFLADHRDRWIDDPDSCLIWPQAPGGAAALLLTGPDEVEPLERSIRVHARNEILDAAIERDPSLTRLFQISESQKDQAVTAFAVDLERLGMTLSFVDRDPLAESFWEDPQARFLIVLATLTLLGLALGLSASLRAVAKESRLSRMRADFISSVSHELKTPLTSLRLYSDLLAKPVTTAEKRLEYQSRISEETKKLTHLVGNVLDAARIEAGREYRMEPVDLAELANSCVLTFQARAEARGASIERGFCEEACLVLGDADALAQVLSNLLDNAIKYGGARIVLDLRRNLDQCELRVQDDGPGIPKAQRARLFSAYERGTEHGPDRAPGSGLGLAIAADIVRAHSGARIEIDDGLAGGMSMLVSFPALTTMADTGTEAKA